MLFQSGVTNTFVIIYSDTSLLYVLEKNLAKFLK
jgi:hypothetical protein